MRIVFMGTPDFTVPILEALDKAGHDIAMVVTQPDAPVGRKAKLTPPPAKVWAADKNIPVFQPRRMKDEGVYGTLKDCNADVFIVAAFGQLLPGDVLNIPRFGCINIHASLLPKYRGASPIQWAILNGDEITGVTIMQMGEGLDDGDILLQKTIPVSDDDTGESLFDKLAVLGGEAITEALSLLSEGRLSAVPQDEALATHVKKIDKSLGKLDLGRPAAELVRYIRGLYPWPGTFVTFRDKPLKILSARAVSAEAFGIDASDTVCGKTISASGEYWIVATGDGALSIRRVLPPGKKAMAVSDFLRGYHVTIDDILS